MPDIRMIGPGDWKVFRDVRLASLTDAPFAFGSTLADAQARTDPQWASMVRARSTADAAIWIAEAAGSGAVGVIGADRDVTTNETELVSMWVSPEHRGSGLSRRLVDAVLTWAAEAGSASVALWVMRGNERARWLYESAGFTVDEHHVASPDDPCRDEIRMTRTVRDPGPHRANDAGG